MGQQFSKHFKFKKRDKTADNRAGRKSRFFEDFSDAEDSGNGASQTGPSNTAAQSIPKVVVCPPIQDGPPTEDKPSAPGDPSTRDEPISDGDTSMQAESSVHGDTTVQTEISAPDVQPAAQEPAAQPTTQQHDNPTAPARMSPEQEVEFLMQFIDRT